MALAPEAGLVLGAVEVDQQRVDAALLGPVEPFEGVGDLAVDEPDGRGDALAEVAGAAVAQLDGLVLARRGAAGHRRPAAGPAVEERPRPPRWGCRGNRGSPGR